MNKFPGSILEIFLILFLISFSNFFVYIRRKFKIVSNFEVQNYSLYIHNGCIHRHINYIYGQFFTDIIKKKITHKYTNVRHYIY